jgi:hypothetical protein
MGKERVTLKIRKKENIGKEGETLRKRHRGTE